jgi:hypothetical protein
MLGFFETGCGAVEINDVTGVDASLLWLHNTDIATQKDMV